MGESAPGSQRLGIDLGSIYSVPAPCVVHVLLCDLLFLQAKEKKRGVDPGSLESVCFVARQDRRAVATVHLEAISTANQHSSY